MIKKSPLIIIGMHRSGTSFLSRCLEHFGVFMGYNKDVNNESRVFMEHNELLLAHHNSDWIEPKEVDITAMQFTNFQLLSHFGSLKKPFVLFKNLQKQKWGWKDPRNTFTLKYWLNLFPDAKVIHIYRNGIDVALSLQSRNKRMSKFNQFQTEQLDSLVNGLKQWELYLDQAFGYTYEGQLLHVCYERLIKKDPNEMELLESFLGFSVKSYLQERAVEKETATTELGDEKSAVEAQLKSSKWMYKLNYYQG